MGEIAYFDELWAQMPVILAISRAGTLEGAAKQLNVNRTTVGRRLKTIERKLGGSLFTRSDGGYHLTALGRQILAAAEGAEIHLMAVEGILPDQAAQNSGPLRIAVAPHVLPLVSSEILLIARKNPQFRMEVCCSYRMHEIEAREADIAIRIQKSPPEYPLVARKLMDLPGALYTKAGPKPDKIVQIARQGEAEIPSFAKSWPANTTTIDIDDIIGKKELILAGGVGRLPNFMAEDDTRLQRISENLPFAGWHLWLISHEAFKSSRRVKIVMEVIAQAFSSR